MRFGFVIGMIGLAGLTGCAAAPLGSPGVATPGMPNIQSALNRAIERTDAAADQMNGTPMTQLASARLPAVIPAELQQPIQWHYRGNLVHAVRALARIVGYQTIVERSHPPQSIPVVIAAGSVPVMTLIRELGIQAGARADVSVDPRTHTISVIETGATAIPAATMPPPSASIPSVDAIQPGGPMIPANPPIAPNGTDPNPLPLPSGGPQPLRID